MLIELFTPLNRKLLRDLWAIKGQALAIALVIGCGVGMYVMSRGMIASLEETRRAYYERYRLADVIAPVKRAPDWLLQEITALPGVRLAETRIRVGAMLDVEGTVAPVTGRIQSLPRQINDLVLRKGRLPDSQREDEVLVLESFADAHRLEPGDHFHALLNGVRKRLTVTGTVLSPEYVYAIPPGALVPDAKRFGALWMNRDALGHAFDLDGAFNEALILTSPGSDEQALIDELDTLLKRYGATGAYGRDQQFSDRFLSSEIDQLKTMGRLLPPIFLLVAAFLLNVVVSRLIDTEREQIGLLKAFGYTDTAVGVHYLKMIGLVTLLGILLGSFMGAWLGGGLADMYLHYFKFPFLLFRAPPHVYLAAAGFSLLVAVLGTLFSVLRATRLDPAVAMVPPPPPDYSRSLRWIEKIARWTDQPTRMILRHLYRWPKRAALTVLGIAMAMGLFIGSNFYLGAMVYMVDISFNVIDRQDATLTFVEPRNARAVQDVLHLPGVMTAEPYRAVPAVLRNGLRQRREAVIGLGENAQLSRVVDTHFRAVEIPGEGIVLSDKLAELMDIRVGELLRLELREGRRPEVEVPVAAIVKTYLGTAAYMNLESLGRLMKEETTMSGAYLLVDPEKLDDLYREVKRTPVVAAISLQSETRRSFYETLHESLGTVVLFNTLFAGLIAIGVVYNSARISLAERSRELASLRVLGLTRHEVSYILLGELALHTLLALPLGAGLGYLLAWTLVASFDTDLFRIPLVVEPSTYGYAALLVIIAGIGSGLMVRRSVDRLDLIAVLKTRE